MTKTMTIIAMAMALSGCDRSYTTSQMERANSVVTSCGAAGGTARYNDSWGYPGRIEVVCLIGRSVEK